MGPKHIFFADLRSNSCQLHKQPRVFRRNDCFFFQSLSSPYLRLKFHPVFFLKSVRPEKAKQPNEHACYGLTLK